MHIIPRPVYIAALFVFCFSASAKGNVSLLDSIFNYRSRMVAMLEDSITTSTDIEYRFNVERRNFMLMFVPSMFEISRGKRQYEGKANYSTIIYKDGRIKSDRLSYDADTYHGRRVMKVTDNLLFPNIYNQTFYEDLLLSPFHRSNQRFYKYRTTKMAKGLSEVVFTPRARNTQFLSGRAFVDSETGRIIKVDVAGEYDMVSFNSHIEMNDSGLLSFVPKNVRMNITFRFLGNKIESTINGCMYGNQPSPPEETLATADTASTADTTSTADSPAIDLKDDVDNISMNMDGAEIINLDTDGATEKLKRKPFYKKLDFLILNLSSQFGKDDNVKFRMSPIINPLYVSYNHKRGITYRSKARLDWAISDSLRLRLSTDVGYSFRQKSFYYTIPAKLYIGNSHNMYAEAAVGKKIAYYDDIPYTDLYVNAKYNYDLSAAFGFQAGVMMHKRLEHSFAPYLQITYRPGNVKDLCLALDYERSFPDIFGANAKYEKYEFSAALSRVFDKVSKMTSKISGGLYTSRSKGTYTLDYKNFNYNYLPNGWEDWGGEFQLLSSRLYNQSEWYAASNVCYETPMLAFSYLPIVGRYTEEERLYFNMLFAEKMHPYIEYGYAFANRLFSVGFFLATRNFKYDGLGVNFSFELFNKW